MLANNETGTVQPIRELVTGQLSVGCLPSPCSRLLPPVVFAVHKIAVDVDDTVLCSFCPMLRRRPAIYFALARQVAAAKRKNPAVVFHTDASQAVSPCLTYQPIRLVCR